MIYKGTQAIESLRKGATEIGTVYRGLVIVWEGIKSCFGGGLWLNEKPWLNTDAWKN